MPDSYNELDILRQIERLTRETNTVMERRSRSVLRRYPLTFTILALFGVVGVSEGAKGVIELVGFDSHPFYMFFAGLLILTLTGTLYRKLDK